MTTDRKISVELSIAEDTDDVLVRARAILTREEVALIERYGVARFERLLARNIAEALPPLAREKSS